MLFSLSLDILSGYWDGVIKSAEHFYCVIKIKMLLSSLKFYHVIKMLLSSLNISIVLSRSRCCYQDQDVVINQVWTFLSCYQDIVIESELFYHVIEMLLLSLEFLYACHMFQNQKWLIQWQCHPLICPQTLV